MSFIYPDFYPEFECKAGNCRHSCCLGWEIDIDSESLALYESIGGEIGERLRKSISHEGSPHFVLDSDERCPFLRTDGLCELILTLGEASLCDICTEHPRFYTELPGRLEAGLGLCCEEAVRLLLSSDEPLRLVCEGEDSEPPAVIALRDRVFGVLSDRSIPLCERFAAAMSLFGEELPQPKLHRLAEFLLGLEYMDGAWHALLKSLGQSERRLSPIPNDPRYERVAEYLVYRHFAAEGEAKCRFYLELALLAAMLLAELENLGTCELPELLRLFSSEIEYSDENIAVIISRLEELSAERGSTRAPCGGRLSGFAADKLE